MENKQLPQVNNPYARRNIIEAIKHYPRQVLLARFEDGEGVRRLSKYSPAKVDTPRSFFRSTRAGRTYVLGLWLLSLLLMLAVVVLSGYALSRREDYMFIVQMLCVGLFILFILSALKTQGWIRWMLVHFMDSKRYK